VDGYGRCWQPTVAVVSPSWRPYCDRGRWLWTDCGWYWYSDYSWGWAPFHYGRWCSHPRVGWFWVPDNCWGPSWVSWRHTWDYCGWAPLPPGVRFVNGRGFFHNGIGLGFSIGDFGLSASLYTFVPLGHFHDRAFYNHRVSGAQAVAIYKTSTVINNYTVNTKGVPVNHGIAVDKLAGASGHKIPTVAIHTSAPLPIPCYGGRVNRHEQLQNNGAVLTVVQPRAASKSTHASSVVPSGAAATRTASLNPGLISRPAGNAVPANNASQEKPVRASAPSASAPYWRPQPGTGLTASRSENPQIPRPAARTQSPPQPTRTLNVTPQAPPSKPYRVYAEPGALAKPASPRVESPVPQYGHSAAVFASPNGPTYSRPAPNAYHAEAPRNPIVHSDSAHSSAPAPSVSHANASSSGGSTHAASSNSSGSGSKSGGNGNKN